MPQPANHFASHFSWRAAAGCHASLPLIYVLNLVMRMKAKMMARLQQCHVTATANVIRFQGRNRVPSGRVVCPTPFVRFSHTGTHLIHMDSRGASATRAGSAAARQASGAAEQLELPSGKYNGIPEPSPVLLQRAAEPPHPVLPRQTRTKAVGPPTIRERVPLAASLMGSGRAGKVGCLKGSTGSRYIGQVLAGRPHGQGRCFVQAAQPGGPMRLAYEGQFVKGVREGSGTCWFSNGEVYTGSWQANQRHGAGKLVHADGGGWYDGAWRADRRNGVGTLHSSNGDVFVGTFVDDKREGLGTTFMPSRGKKFVAEYVNDRASCGSFFELCDDDVEAPPSQQLRSTIMSRALEQAAAGTQQPRQLPVLQLMQPSKVLSQGFVAVRRERQTTPAQAAVQGSGRTLTADSVNLLRHAFILIACGDDLASYVLPHQLQELVVLAGFDPASEPVVRLVEQLTAHGSSSPAGDGRLSLDQFLHVVVHFREQQLAVVPAAASSINSGGGGGGGSHSLLQQQRAVAACNVVDGEPVREEQWLPDESVGAQEASLEFLQQRQQQQPDGATEVNEQPADQELRLLAAGGGSSSSWGAATHDDMLAKHIADHRHPSTPPPAAATAACCAGNP